MSTPPAVLDKHQRLWKQADSYARQGQPSHALGVFESILDHRPGDVTALLRASRLSLSLGQYLRARGYALQALAERPQHEDAVMALAKALRMFNEPLALFECVEHSRWRERRSAMWLTDLAMLASSIGDNTLGMEILDLAVAVAPRHAPTRYFRGVVRMFFGEMEASEMELEACIALDPGLAQAHWVLSRLRRQTESPNHVVRLQSTRTRAVAGKDGDAYLSFALHNELHDLGRYDQSWQALERGCGVKRRMLPHDRAGAAQMYEGLTSLCTEDFVKPVEQDTGPFVPIFIVGMHRSGSTLLEQLLAGHPDVQDGGETYSFNTQMRFAADYRNKGALDAELVRRAASIDYSLVGRRFHEQAAWRAKGAPFLTEKLPSNFLNLGFIAKALPTARILHMVRDPMDTCFSNLRTSFSDVNTFSYDQAELVEWFGQYRNLMAHWRKVMPDRVMDVRYDQLVADPEATMRGVLEFCGLPWHQAATGLQGGSAVATASSPQMRQGIIKDRKAAWEPYRDKLATLLAGLEPHG